MIIKIGKLITAQGVSIDNCNFFNTPIDEKFRDLYSEFFRDSKPFISEDFKSESYKLFESFTDLVSDSDAYFNNFTVISTELWKKSRPAWALNFWEGAISFVEEWEEKNNKKLHKGTPFYFASASAILEKDLDAAFILMNFALEEDKKNATDYKKTPAYYFLSLDDQKLESYLRPIIILITDFLRDRLDGQGSQKGRYKEFYNQKRAGNLSYSQLRTKFYDSQFLLDDLKIFFNYCIAKLLRLREIHKGRHGENLMAPILLSQSLGGILIVIENLLKLKFGNGKTFGPLFMDMANNEGWIVNLPFINQNRDNNFGSWVDDCINADSLLGDFSLAYGLRNFSFHTIQSQEKIWNEYTKILQSILNCFFKILEIL